ncbi:pyrimidine/purine nucleoside phosphorylase [Xenorhabdus sp. PR6a]|uniref:pyrimidine/purine nucleoside phosphorylase n=1 Tax=Xenorhabdus sp. PR6a TaxID=3025877 RepID=UPI00235A351E|nr:pyrimidine/purine nucleoside phosphorylase [Xenorhabdus sp. PR6a]MDC9581486.1 pyrimidine/purine nucleoside phosphorylase [Xenorhabdus sp. PR6a]
MSELFQFKETHIFFDGKVVLRNFLSDGVKVTMGYMATGEFRWLAEEPERFHILSGNAEFIVGSDRFIAEQGSEIFVPAGSTFTVNVSESLDYRCYYD